MFTAGKLVTIITDVLRLHAEHPKTPNKAFRKFDGRTPYGVHEVLLGMLALHEENLQEELRMRIALVLFGHEILEDTTAELPAWAIEDPKVEKLIHEMTFDKGQEKYVEMWKRDPNILLPELFDCTANLMCAGTKSPERSAKCKGAVQELLDHIEPRYPGLEISKIARALLQ